MDTLSAFARGAASRGQPLKVFDWNRAAQLIRERHPQEARAGLGLDWEWTGGTIYKDGEPLKREDTYTYLASTWAIPELDLDGEVLPCWIDEKDVPTEWGNDYPKVFWPPSALDILRAEAVPT